MSKKLMFLFITGLLVFLQGCGPHALIRSANSGNLADVRSQLEKENADVNMTDAQGNTPLHHAAWKGNLSVAEYLLKKGASVNVKDHAGQTALHLAATHGHDDIVKLLIDNGADVNARKNNGSTPLILAAMNNGKKSVEYLLQAGADVNVENNTHASAYDYALVRGYADIESMLSSRGAKRGKMVEMYSNSLKRFSAMLNA